MNVSPSRRAQPGTLKAKLAALPVGGTLPAGDKLERNKLYSVARRLGITLQSNNGQMKRLR